MFTVRLVAASSIEIKVLELFAAKGLLSVFAPEEHAESPAAQMKYSFGKQAVDTFALKNERRSY